MMSLGEHLLRGLFSSWRFLCFDPDADKFLEVSGRAGLRSFWAMLFGVPLYGLYMFLVMSDPGATRFALVPLWLFVAGYILVWPCFALFMFYIAPVIDCAGRYMRFIIAYNWVRPLATLLQVPGNIIILLGLTGAAGSPLHTGLIVVNNGLALALKTHVAHKTLKAPLVMALLIVSFDVLIAAFEPYQAAGPASASVSP